MASVLVSTKQLTVPVKGSWTCACYLKSVMAQEVLFPGMSALGVSPMVPLVPLASLGCYWLSFKPLVAVAGSMKRLRFCWW